MDEAAAFEQVHRRIAGQCEFGKEHQFGAGRLSRHGRPFLGGLEDEQHLAGQFVAARHQGIGHAHQDRHVHVVAAGVHHPDRLAAVFAAHGGSERQAGLFGDR